MDLLQLSTFADEIKTIILLDLSQVVFFFSFPQYELLEGLGTGKVVHYCTTFLLMHLSGTNYI